jgi:outer membrane protein assembly factor BamB
MRRNILQILFVTKVMTVLAIAGAVMFLGCDLHSRPMSLAVAADEDSSSKTANGNAAAKIKPPGPTSWASFRNGNTQRGVAGSKLPDKLELLWKLEDVDGFPATSAIVGDHVYAAALSGYLYCLDRKSGRTLWKYRSIDDPNPDTFAAGFKSAPTVTANSVFVGDEDGVLHAVSRKTGIAIWKFETDGEIAGVAVQGKNIIASSHDSFLYCLQASDGTLVWKFQTLDRINCSPAIVEGYTFVAGCDEHMRVINLKNGKQKSDIPLDSYLIASPAVVGDMLYVGTYAGEVLAVNWKTDTIVWRYSDPVNDHPYHASAAVTDKYVIVGGQDKQLHCIDRKTGKRVWVFRAKGQINSSPVIVGDRVVFGSNDRNVYAVSLKEGKQVWKYNTGRGISAGPAVGENVLVVGTDGSEGVLLCFGKK